MVSWNKNMIIDWNIHTIKNEIDKIAFQESNHSMDGYNCWRAKQELYQILWYVEEKLKRTSEYSLEDEYIQNHRINEMWSILKDDN